MVASFPGPRLWNVDIEVVQVWRAWYFLSGESAKGREEGHRAIDIEEVEQGQVHKTSSLSEKVVAMASNGGDTVYNSSVRK